MNLKNNDTLRQNLVIVYWLHLHNDRGTTLVAAADIQPRNGGLTASNRLSPLFRPVRRENGTPGNVEI